MLIVTLKKNQVKKVKYFEYKNIRYYLYILFCRITFQKTKVVK